MKIYLAGPVKKHREIINEMASIMRNKKHEVYVPSEHKIENAWDYSNKVWGEKVFNKNIEAINNCDLLVVASYDNSEHHGGTRWETGYAFGIGKKILLVHYEKEEVSLMIANGCFASVNGLEEFKQIDLENITNYKYNLPQT